MSRGVLLGLVLLMPIRASGQSQKGAVIASIWVDGQRVDARSNGYHADGTANHDGPHQCVVLGREVVEKLGGSLPALGSSSGAAEIFSRAKTWPKYACYPNGSNVRPDLYDLVVYDNGGLGHVAVVKAVSPDTLTLVEQNWSMENGQVTFRLTHSGSTYTLPNRQGKTATYVCVGWVRYLGNPWVDYPTATPISLQKPGGRTIRIDSGPNAWRFELVATPGCTAKVVLANGRELRLRNLTPLSAWFDERFTPFTVIVQVHDPNGGKATVGVMSRRSAIESNRSTAQVKN